MSLIKERQKPYTIYTGVDRDNPGSQNYPDFRINEVVLLHLILSSKSVTVLEMTGGN